MTQILIAIHNKIYEVSKFIKSHPGEGIGNMYLRDFHRKDATEEFEAFHFTNESFEMLKSSQDSFDEAINIHYVCPNFFNIKKSFNKSRIIPKYFHFLPNDPYGIEYMKDKDKNTFILRPSNSDKNNSLSITYKDDYGDIHQLKITRSDIFDQEDKKK